MNGRMSEDGKQLLLDPGVGEPQVPPYCGRFRGSVAVPAWRSKLEQDATIKSLCFKTFSIRGEMQMDPTRRGDEVAAALRTLERLSHGDGDDRARAAVYGNAVPLDEVTGIPMLPIGCEMAPPLSPFVANGAGDAHDLDGRGYIDVFQHAIVSGSAVPFIQILDGVGLTPVGLAVAAQIDQETQGSS